MEPETVKSVGEASELSLSGLSLRPRVAEGESAGHAQFFAGSADSLGQLPSGSGARGLPTGSLHVRSLCALELPKPLPSEEATRKFLQQIFESTGRTSAQGLLGSGTRRDSTSASPRARAPGRPGGGAGTAFARRVAVAHPGPQPASSTFTRNCPHLWLSAAQVFGANPVNYLSLCKDPGCLQAEARLRLSSEVFSGGVSSLGAPLQPTHQLFPPKPPIPTASLSIGTLAMCQSSHG